MLDQSAQTLGRQCNRRVAECCRLALDVVRGVEQGIARVSGQARVHHGFPRGVEPLAFRDHPGRELGRQLRQGLFRALDRMLAVERVRCFHGSPQTVRRRDDLGVVPDRRTPPRSGAPRHTA